MYSTVYYLLLTLCIVSLDVFIAQVPSRWPMDRILSNMGLGFICRRCSSSSTVERQNSNSTCIPCCGFCPKGSLSWLGYVPCQSLCTLLIRFIGVFGPSIRGREPLDTRSYSGSSTRDGYRLSGHWYVGPLSYLQSICLYTLSHALVQS